MAKTGLHVNKHQSLRRVLETNPKIFGEDTKAVWVDFQEMENQIRRGKSIALPLTARTLGAYQRYSNASKQSARGPVGTKSKDYQVIALEFAQEVSRQSVLYVVLFGSVARNDTTVRSDLDIFVVFESEEVPNNTLAKIGHIARGLEEKHTIRLRAVYANCNYDGIDEYFLQKVFSEGIILYAKRIEVTLKGKHVRPFTFVAYPLNNLAQPKKLKLKNKLLGYDTKKKVKAKTYSSSFPALLRDLGGRQLGRGTILVPTHNISPIEELLRQFKARYSATETWLFA